VDFARYMAENFSAFDYKTQEEVFTVIKHLTSILSTSGMQLVEILSPTQLLDQLHGQAPAAEPASVSFIPIMYCTPAESYLGEFFRSPSRW
jgi:cohesin loading factor subunit SCC2